jgi:Tol biopolymer transport system component/tRNA A-37 threonylcarbamoyl transferase component Bud32
MLGQVLSHHRIVSKLGSGGMGDVYAAEDTVLHRRVALKVLRSDIADDEERRERFAREATAVAALNHPNIVTVYSLEEADGIRFITMELVEGTTLAELIPRGGMPLDTLLKIAVPLADAVGAAHQRGITHRDLKPGNVMVARDGRVKVLDFGLAKLLDPHPDATMLGATAPMTMTAKGQIVGTVAYMSPEQAEGGVVDHRSDIFSLGVILFEMATGQRPFTGGTPLSVLSAITRDTPPPVNEIRPQLPRELARIVRRCLAKHPDRRCQSALDLRNELQDLQQDLEAGELSAPATAMPATRRVPVAWLVLGVAAVALIGWTAYWLGTRQDTGARNRLDVAFTQITAQPGTEQFPSLSPDGRWVVYAADEGKGNDVYLQSVGGQVPINLTKDSPAPDTEPVFSPDGEQIAFRSERDGGGIFVMGRTGESVRRVTNTGFNPSWSPDAKELVFATQNVVDNPFGRNDLSQLWIARVATGEKRRLSVHDGVQPSWSPQGLIAYWAIADSRGASDIWVIPANGGDPVRVTDDMAVDWNPVWSPDGRYVYYASNRGGSMNLWRIPVDEQSGRPRGASEPLTTPAPYVAHISLARDGRRVAYTSLLQTQNIQRVAFNPATGTLAGPREWVTRGSRLWSSPDPSPDGTSIAVYPRLQQQEDIYVIATDGTGVRQVMDDAPGDRVPRWSPDGRWIAYFSDRTGPNELWAIGPDGTGLRQLTETRDGTFFPVWSPDGARMAVSAGSGGTWRTLIFDPRRPWRDQAPETLPKIPEPGAIFMVQTWSRDGTRLAGQASPSPSGGGVVAYTIATKQYQRLTTFGEWPAWLSDSRRLVFVSGGKDVYLVDSISKKTQKLFSSEEEVIGPPRPTRDDRYMYFSARTAAADIWLMTLSGPAEP